LKVTERKYLFGLLSCILVFGPSLLRSQWVLQSSGTTERLRAVSAVSPFVVWASGNHGTILRSTDAGVHWVSLRIPGTDSLDFRDVDAMSATVAFVLSIGEGDKSRIYKTTNGGIEWNLSFINRDPRGFFDAMAFWDENSGVAVGDEVDGRITIIRTSDGGSSWHQVRAENMPPALPGEGAFAASGTCVAVSGASNAWIGTGVNCARVYRSTDRGMTWNVSSTPIAGSSTSTGVFSVYFLDGQHGVAVGGDYRKEADADRSASFSTDGGRTWSLSSSLPSGFRSCVVAVPNASPPALIAVGPNGSDASIDGGATWARVDTTGFHAVSFAGSRNSGWAVGERGIIARFEGAALPK